MLFTTIINYFDEISFLKLKNLNKQRNIDKYIENLFLMIIINEIVDTKYCIKSFFVIFIKKIEYFK